MSPAAVLSRVAAIAAAAVLISGNPVAAYPGGDTPPLSGPGAVRPTDDAALSYALMVKKRSAATSKAELLSFGAQALNVPTVENMARLQHVIFVLMEHREYAQAAEWNENLRQLASRGNNNDFEAVADINAVTIVHLRDKTVPLGRADALMRRYNSGVAGEVALILKARILIDGMEAPAAIGLLGDALRKGEGKDTLGRAALWRHLGLAHSLLDDVPGFLVAMKAFEAEIAKKGYPTPEHESIYTLALTLGYVGRYEEAAEVLAIYRELAQRANTPMQLALAGNLCGYIAAARDDWAEVLKCYEPFGPSLDVPGKLSNIMLPRRAVGYAREGQPALAMKDLREIRERVDRGIMPFSPSVHRAEAEVMIATGDYRRGIKALRDYHLNQFRTVTKNSAAVMSDVVVDVETQLRATTAQNEANAALIRTQWWLMAVITVLALGLILLVLRQRRLAKALAKANERERESHAKRAQFFVDISHEIRTPLNGVVAIADALSKETLPADVAEKVRLIANSSEMLNRLLSDVLDNAKMEAGELTIKTAAFDLAALVRDVEAMWRDKAEAKSLKLSLQSDIGECYWVRGDSVRLGEVLNNLVSNALKFTPEGRILLNVVKVPGERCLFVVTDTGIGFDEESEGHIFERYRQADRTISSRFGGTGLGLSISYKLVEMMGGKLNAASRPGKGSQFWFELPLPETFAPARGPEAVLSSAERSDVLRMLIVDDNATNRTILGMLLNDKNYQLHYASNGLEAVELAMSISFDVILMDMQMPVMDGLEAIRQIRAKEMTGALAPSAIVIFSANDSAEDHRRGAEAGADGFVSKPIVLDRLLDAINSAIQVRDHRANVIDIMNIGLK